MKILGVDPGLRTTGYGVIECTGDRIRLIEGGVVRPRAAATLAQRLAELHDGMRGVVRSTRPDCMVVEELWVGARNPQTAVLMGHARGVIALVAGKESLPFHTLGHALVKRALAGNGAARKTQVAAMVAQLLGLRTTPEPADVTDALALAIAFANVDGHARRLAALGVTLAPRRPRAARAG